MNTRNKKYLVLSWAILLIIFSGCHDVEIMTHVLPDGSILRVVSIPGDSTKIYASAYPVPLDSSWQITRAGKENSKGFIYTASKSFKKASEINNEFLSPGDTILYVRPIVKLEKRFRWFYTFYAWNETYKAHGLQFSNADSLLAREVEKRIAEQDSANKDDDSFDIEEELIFEDLYHTILRAAEKINDPTLSPQLVKEKKQDLHDLMIKADGDFDKFVDDVLKACKDVYQTGAVVKLKPFIEQFNEKLLQYLNFIERSIGETYKNSVIMPGVITATNAQKVNGNKASWEVDTDKFQIKDYRMWVESRRMNVLPTVITGLFLLACITGIIVISMKMKKEN
ncbi:MAG: hypothetical protein GXO75_02175 [Calditrichaeota bacterium]|nr:hypothetical protein [Calditrichota bacterium]